MRPAVYVLWLTVAVYAPAAAGYAQTASDQETPPLIVTPQAGGTGSNGKPSPTPRAIRINPGALEPLPSPVVPFASQLPDARLPQATAFPDFSGVALSPRFELMNSNAVGLDGKSIRVYEGTAIPRAFGNYTDVLYGDSKGEALSQMIVKTAMGTVKAGGDWLRLDFRADFTRAGRRYSLQAKRVFEFDEESAMWAERKFIRSYYDAAKLLVREEEYRDQIVYSASEYSPTGLLTREERYLADGQPDEILSYDYKGGYPVRVSAFDVAGSLRYTIALEYTMSGFVSKTEKTFADGSGELFSYRYGSMNVSASWADGPADGIRWVYDNAGRLIRTEEWKDGAVVRQTSLQYVSPDNSGLVSRETVDKLSSVRHLEVFDDKSHVVQIDDSVDGSLVSRTIQSWDEKDRVLTKRVVTGDLTETWDYSYDGDSLSSERYAKNDVPVRVVSYQGSERIEELYLNGKALLRIYYRDNQRYKEEELRDGLVVRTRDYSQSK